MGIGNRWKVDGNKLERIGEFAVLGGDGGNARSREGCQAGQCLMIDCWNYKESML